MNMQAKINAISVTLIQNYVLKAFVFFYETPLAFIGVVTTTLHNRYTCLLPMSSLKNTIISSINWCYTCLYTHLYVLTNLNIKLMGIFCTTYLTNYIWLLYILLKNK